MFATVASSALQAVYFVRRSVVQVMRFATESEFGELIIGSLIVWKHLEDVVDGNRRIAHPKHPKSMIMQDFYQNKLVISTVFGGVKRIIP